MIRKNRYLNDIANRPTEFPPGLEYLARYPTPTRWHDVDFPLFHSNISRVQHSCSCNSGAQLPGCCCHVSSALWMIWSAVNRPEILDLNIKETRRDRKIRMNLCNVAPYKPWAVANSKGKLCYCDEDKEEQLKQCDNCRRFYHPSCLKSSWEQIRSWQWIQGAWYCSHCDTNSIWVGRHI